MRGGFVMCKGRPAPLLLLRGENVANGHTDINPEELHRTGCEYGRGLAKDVSYMRGDVAELKDGMKELREGQRRIEQQLAKSEWLRTLGAGLVSAITAAVVVGALK